jgi:LCP family protein required for cell wall assembly
VTSSGMPPAEDRAASGPEQQPEPAKRAAKGRPEPAPAAGPADAPPAPAAEPAEPTEPAAATPQSGESAGPPAAAPQPAQPATATDPAPGPAQPATAVPPPAQPAEPADTTPRSPQPATAPETGPEPAEPAVPVPVAGTQAGQNARPPAGAIPAVPGTAQAERPRRSYRWLKVLAGVTALLVLAAAGGLWYLYQQLNGNITTDRVTENELQVHASERPPEGPTSAENILLIGSDNRGNGNGKYGKDSGTQRSDTAILLHIAADRHSATAMSIPRDLMAHVPSCTRPDGAETEPKFEQFNWAFEFGGAACTIRTVENMTGIRIDHHLVVDFSGFKKIVDSVGGVDVCLAEPVHDSEAHLDLPAGRQTLDGEQALGYVRARHGFGDGSDTQRMDRQQGFLGSLFSKVTSNGVLLNPGKVYPVLSAATSSLTADPGLDSLSELYALAREIQRIPSQNMAFLTLPQEQYTLDHNRDQLKQPAADDLFSALRDDLPVSVTADGHPDGSAAPGDSAATTAPDTPGTSGTGAPAPGDTPTTAPSAKATYRGTTAAADICGKAAK